MAGHVRGHLRLWSEPSQLLQKTANFIMQWIAIIRSTQLISDYCHFFIKYKNTKVIERKSAALAIHRQYHYQTFAKSFSF